MQHLIVIAIGRSGSTLLNGVLNSCSSVLMRGENQLFLNHLTQAYLGVKRSVALDTSGKPTGPHFGASEFNLYEWLRVQESATNALLLGSKDRSALKILGFKEIRYIELSSDELVDNLCFLEALFPGYKIIYHHRNFNQIANSEWWREFEESGLVSKFREFEEFTLSYLTSNFSDRFLVTNFEVLLEDPTDTINQLTNFLGVDFNIDHVLQVLSEKHSYKSGTVPQLRGTKNVNLFPTLS